MTENEMKAATLDSLEDAIPTLPEVEATFAVEIFGQRCRDSERVRRVATPFLSHPKAYVREGAIYALRYHLDADLVTTIETMAKSDPSTTIRDIAVETLAALDLE